MIEVTDRQNEFLTALANGNNIFLTGKAGTGKSFIANYAMQEMEKAKRKFIAVAPTGIAANNIGGATIHSMFRINPFGICEYDECNFLKTAAKQVLKNTETIIIDEISMLRPDVLDGMHWTLKKNGLKGLDTKQIIFIGDLKQLPVILNDNTRSKLYETYDGHTFLDAQIFKKIQVVTIDLDEIIRQTNPEFIAALNEIRDGKKDPYFKQFVHTEPRGIILAPHNATVQKYNEAGLNATKGELFTFKARIDGTAKPEDFNLDAEINVKNGCKIMYLVNSERNPLRNGTMGIFVSHKGCHYIRVGNTDYALDEVSLTKREYVFDKELDRLELQELGSITQYPFRLAYALSIHKSQGLTFDECTIDLTKPCFMPGQMYVALSRVRTPEGLRIIVK